jgi:zinc protease
VYRAFNIAGYEGGEMLKKLPVVAFLLMLTIPIFAGEARQVTLSNGMVVILKENHSTPMVASIVCVRAGSEFEDSTNNGFTHFLEHLLFNGTKDLSRIELNEGFKDHGGYINAFTQKDLTGYLFVIPSIYSEYALKTQADQLFNSTLPESEFPKERKIVIEEIKMNYDNPDNQADMFFDSLAYQGTPYAKTVLGPINVIETIPREAVLNYYHERYKPNNMIALFIGDFNSQEFIKLIDKYYGVEKPGKLPAVKKFNVDPPYGKNVHYRDYSAKVTRMHFVFPAPSYNEPGYYAMDVLAQILDSGESSPLYQALTAGDDPLVNEMSVYLESNANFSLLHFTASTDDSAKVNQVLLMTERYLSSVKDVPFDKDKLKRIVIKNKTDQIYLEEKLHYFGIMEAPMLVNFGYGYIRDYVHNLSRVEPSDIQKVAADYLSPGKYLAMAAVPAKAEEEQ